MEDNVTFCTNCQRQIAASNFVTHSVHCQRNLVKCESCGEAVPRSSLQEHHAEFHAMVACPNCSVPTERTLLEKHQKTACKSRQQNCQYCELEFTVGDLDEHENYCGSRTKHCECGEYVMLKYEHLHLDSNHGFLKLDDEPGPSAKWIKNDLEGDDCKKVTSNNNLKKPQLSNGKFNNAKNDIDDLGHMLAQLNKPKVWAPPRHGGVAYPLTGVPQRTISPPPQRRSSFSDDDNEEDLVALPCEFCNAMIPSNQLTLHQTGCQLESAIFGFQSKPTNTQSDLTPKQTQVSLSHSNSCVDVVGDSDNESDIEVVPSYGGEEKPLTEKKTLAYDDTELPCEFCDAGYPSALLLEHQDVCELHPKNWRNFSPVRDEPLQTSTSPKLSVHDGTNMHSQQKLNQDLNIYKPMTAGVSGENSTNLQSDSIFNRASIATEWNDLNLARPSSATGAIPKAKAGKLNIARQVAEEVSRPRSSNNKVTAASRAAGVVAGYSYSQPLPRKPNDKSPVRNKLQDHDG